MCMHMRIRALHMYIHNSPILLREREEEEREKESSSLDKGGRRKGEGSTNSDDMLPTS